MKSDSSGKVIYLRSARVAVKVNQQEAIGRQGSADCADLSQYIGKRELRVNGFNKHPRYVNLLEIDSDELTQVQYIIEENIKLRLKLNSGVRLDIDDSFDGIGLDFLMLFELKKSLTKHFKVRLSSVEFSLYSSIASLADHVLEQQKERQCNIIHFCPINHGGNPAQEQQPASVSQCSKDNIVSMFRHRLLKN